MTSILRLFAPLFLVYHASLLMGNFADPAFLLVVTLLACLTGFLLRKWRFIPALGIFIILPLLVQFLQFLLSLIWPSQLGFWDYMPLWWDRQFVLSLLPWFLFCITTYFAEAYKNYIPWERLFFAVLLTGVFWTQGSYHITLYPHPVLFACVLSLYLLAEFGVLYFSMPKGPGSRLLSNSWIRKIGSFIAVIIFICSLAGILWGLFFHYEEASVAGGGGLLKPELFQFDFSKLVRLESEISMGDELVLLYREDGPPQHRYLRRLVLSSYAADKGFFVGSDPADEVKTLGRRIEKYSLPPLLGRESIQQEYYLVNMDPASLISLNEPEEVLPLARWDHSSFVSAYRVRSQVAQESLWSMDSIDSSGLDKSAEQRYLEYGQQKWIKDLALKVTKDSSSYLEKINAIEMFLKDNYLYSLKPGNAPDGDQLKYFLLTSKKGYCSYYAFSMALMLRSLDIPARVAVGFFTNAESGMLGFYPVRAFQAHAWVEVPFKNLGWMSFDPTSEKLAPGENFVTPKNLSPETLSGLIDEIIKADPKVLNEKQLPPASVKASSSLWQKIISVVLPCWYFWILGLYIFLVLLNRFGFWLLWPFLNPRQRVKGLWKRTKRIFSRAHISFLPSATPEEVVQAVGLQSKISDSAALFLNQLCVEVLKSRYAPEFNSSHSALQVYRKGHEEWIKLIALKNRWVNRFFPFVGGRV